MYYNFMNTRDLLEQRIANICRTEYMNFAYKANVVGIALGYKEIKGCFTKQKCLTVFVEKKVPKIELSVQDIIPDIYNGVKTDVIETGAFYNGFDFYEENKFYNNKCNNTSLNSIDADPILKDKVRPTIGGYSIGNVLERGAGTLGCLVSDSRGEYYILSNNHVLADINNNPLGTPIIQPAIRDGGNPQTDIIAILDRYVPLKVITFFSIPENHVDCALGKVINKSIASPEIYQLGVPQGVIIPIIGKKVFKAGRTTGVTSGVIINTDATVVIRGSGSMRSIRYQMVEQIVSRNLNLAGDSGAVILDENNYTVGLVCGRNADKNTTISCPISTVLKELNVRLVTNI